MTELDQGGKTEEIYLGGGGEREKLREVMRCWVQVCMACVCFCVWMLMSAAAFSCCSHSVHVRILGWEEIRQILKDIFCYCICWAPSYLGAMCQVLDVYSSWTAVWVTVSSGWIKTCKGKYFDMVMLLACCVMLQTFAINQCLVSFQNVLSQYLACQLLVPVDR